MAHPAFLLYEQDGFGSADLHTLPTVSNRIVAHLSPLPDDIFRRKAASIRLRNVEKALAELEKALAIDFAASSQAARYHLAARIATLIERPDMEAHFVALRDAAIAKARAAQNTVLRDYSNRDESYDRRPKAQRLKSPRPKKKPDNGATKK